MNRVPERKLVLADARKAGMQENMAGGSTSRSCTAIPCMLFSGIGGPLRGGAAGNAGGAQQSARPPMALPRPPAENVLPEMDQPKPGGSPLLGLAFSILAYFLFGSSDAIVK